MPINRREQVNDIIRSLTSRLQLLSMQITHTANDIHTVLECIDKAKVELEEILKGNSLPLTDNNRIKPQGWDGY